MTTLAPIVMFPIIPTEEPTTSPTLLASDTPSKHPTVPPSEPPSETPTTSPAPSRSPTVNPSDLPTAQPTASPSKVPSLSLSPSAEPTSTPSKIPSSEPTGTPSSIPSVSVVPTRNPSSEPSVVPSVSFVPSVSSIPSFSPTEFVAEGDVNPLNAAEHWSFADNPTNPPSIAVYCIFGVLFLINIIIKIYKRNLKRKEERAKSRLSTTESRLGFLGLPVEGSLAEESGADDENAQDLSTVGSNDSENENIQDQNGPDGEETTEEAPFFDNNMDGSNCDQESTSGIEKAWEEGDTIIDDSGNTNTAGRSVDGGDGNVVPPLDNISHEDGHVDNRDESSTTVDNEARRRDLEADQACANEIDFEECYRKLDWISRIIEISAFLLFFGQEYIIRVGRFWVMWQVGDAYEPAFNDDTNQLVFLHRAYYDVSQPPDNVLEDGGCAALISESRLFPPAESSTCQLLFIKFSLSFATTWWARFSMILGFLLFFALEMQVFVAEDLIKKKIAEHRSGWHWFWRGASSVLSLPLIYILFLLIASHQSLVLMPTAVVTPRPYCLEFDLPDPFISTGQFVCFHLWSLGGIPIGVPLLIGCYVGVRLAATGNDIAMLAGIAMFCAFVIPMVALLGSWFFLGLAFGPWVHFTTYLSQSVFIVTEVMAPMLPFLNDLLNEFFV